MEVRLADMRIRAQKRHEQQSVEERQSLNTYAQHRLSLENQTDRERLSDMRINACQYTRQSSIIEQPILKKLTTFHNKLAIAMIFNSVHIVMSHSLS